MPTIDPRITLGDLVTANPSLARELERRGLDYCCGGARTLHEACTAQGLDPATVVLELAAAMTDATAPSFHCGSLRNPISVMLVEHDRVGELLAELRVLTAGYAVPADGCASYQASYAALAALEADTHLHIHKENNLLFPAVIGLEDRLTGVAS